MKLRLPRTGKDKQASEAERPGVPSDSEGRARPTVSEEPRWGDERPAGLLGLAGNRAEATYE